MRSRPGAWSAGATSTWTTTSPFPTPSTSMKKSRRPCSPCRESVKERYQRFQVHYHVRLLHRYDDIILGRFSHRGGDLRPALLLSGPGDDLRTAGRAGIPARCRPGAAHRESRGDPRPHGRRRPTAMPSCHRRMSRPCSSSSRRPMAPHGYRARCVSIPRSCGRTRFSTASWRSCAPAWPPATCSSSIAANRRGAVLAARSALPASAVALSSWAWPCLPPTARWR